MTPLVLIPDAEKVVSDYLREVDEVEAIVGRRVVGKTPSSVAEPWVRLTRINAADDANSSADHLVAFYLQADCYAGASGGQPEANLLGRTVRAALKAMQGTSVGGTVVSRVRVSDGRIADPQLEPARERTIVTATVYMHGT